MYWTSGSVISLLPKFLIFTTILSAAPKGPELGAVIALTPISSAWGGTSWKAPTTPLRPLFMYSLINQKVVSSEGSISIFP